MRRHPALLVLPFLFFSAGLHAEVKTRMDQMLVQIVTLKPFISSEAEFKDPKNAAAISTALEKMKSISRSVTHEQKIKNTSFSIPASLLQQQLSESEIVFRTGNKEYALWLLRSTLNNCMACHTRVPAVSTRFETLSKDRFITSSFDEAEFLFIVRNFKKALEYYNRSIAEYPSNGIGAEKIETALHRIIYYYIRVERDPAALASSLQSAAKNATLDPYLQRLLASYRQAALALSRQRLPRFDESHKEELRRWAQGILKNEIEDDSSRQDPMNVLKSLQLSSVLYEYLEENPESSLRPSIYYWLSFCEQHWPGFSFESLPEMYLKKCITLAPGETTAPACLKAYKNLQTSAYTGTSGTHMPPDVLREIGELEKLIAQAQKTAR